MEREEAARLMTDAGVRAPYIARHTVWDCCTCDYTMSVWELGTWGPDEYSVTVLGSGQTLDEAVRDWQRGRTPRGRRGT